MNDFNKCNKISGVRWLKKPVEDIQIKVKLKPQDGILSLPKFEDYANESHELNITNLETKIGEYYFKWQEKVFSRWEIQRYTDVHNCLTETELSYHEMLTSKDFEPSKIFTYIHEDCYIPLPGDLKKENVNLNYWMEQLDLNDKVGRVLGKSSSSLGHLFRSEENVSDEKEQWTSMHVVFDNSEYNDDSQLLLKQEATLLSLFYNTSKKYLIITPNENNIALNPYAVETKGGQQWGYQYSVGISFLGEENGDELMSFLRKLYKKWERKQRLLLNFTLPPLGKKQYYLSLEILSAQSFECDDMYVKFTVKLPDGVTSGESLHGRTHVASSLRDEDEEQWLFGHMLELNLEALDQPDPPTIQLFFEVISTDWWGRHRTEGYTYLARTLTPGYASRQLSCSRPEELNDTEAANRRFFVGGCNLIKNLDVLAAPQLQDANFKYVTTGTLTIRTSIISVAPLPGSDISLTGISGVSVGSSASALLQGAEVVLRQYRRARARLAAATEDLKDSGRDERREDGDGDRWRKDNGRDKRKVEDGEGDRCVEEIESSD